MALIELKDVTKTYGQEAVLTPVLRGVSLTIEDGEFVSIMGPSGSGKSTLMHIMGLLDRVTTGTYTLDRKNTATLTDEQLAAIRNHMIGFVFQAFHLLGRTTVRENVMLALQYSDVPRREWASKAEAVLKRVNLSHRLNHYPSQISGGEKQRVAIARALVLNPKIIFADEPTGNLDSKSGQAVLDLIKELNTQGHTIILVTHELEAARTAKRIVTIRDGLIASDALLTDQAFGGDGLLKVKGHHV
jgi:putative ABC transport system ATP-binding protein